MHSHNSKWIAPTARVCSRWRWNGVGEIYTETESTNSMTYSTLTDGTMPLPEPVLTDGTMFLPEPMLIYCQLWSVALARGKLDSITGINPDAV